MDQKKAVLRTVFIFTAVMAAVTLIYMLLTTIVSNRNKMVIDTDSMKLVQLEPVKDGDPVAIVETSLGEIRMRLFPEYSPEAVKNFTEHKDNIVDMTLTYTEGSGKIDAAKYMNRSGKVLYVKDYDSNFKTCTFKLDDELGTEMTLNSQVTLFQSAFDSHIEGKSKISKYILEYDDKGRLIKVEYAGFGNIRVPDGQ